MTYASQTPQIHYSRWCRQEIEARETAPFAIPKKANYSVHPEPYPVEVPGFASFSNYGFWLCNLVTPALIVSLFKLPLVVYPLVLAATIVPTWAAYVVIDSIIKNQAHSQKLKSLGIKLTDYMTFTDAELAAKFENQQRIPMETFFEAYFAGKIEMRGDMLDLLEHRHDWASFRFTLGHLKFIANHLLPEVTVHSRSQDKEQVTEHYDRGNDFYGAFLGPMMIYTSGIIGNVHERETLEQMQTNKLDLVLNKIDLQPGEKLLDIGCGWGTLLAHAAKKYGAQVTGVTLAKEQTEFGLQRAKDEGVSDKVRILNHDYRDIPRPHEPQGIKYNKITCLEMAEHVGIRKFNRFLLQVDELLEDDGIFYLQIAGLRRPWQYEDLVWGLFMNKYVFPGADASCPLAWVIGQLEYAGFEVQGVDTIGVHYSATIERWYQNWMKPEHRELVTRKYGDQAWRVWEFFLGWSTVISRQGSATCYQIVAHKNRNNFKRAGLLKGYNQSKLLAKAPQESNSSN